MDESGERKPGPFSPWPLPRRRSQIDRRQLHLRTLLRWTHFAARHVLIWINKAARFNLKADPPKASVEQGFCRARLLSSKASVRPARDAYAALIRDFLPKRQRFAI
jgi:hypothetical protein